MNKLILTLCSASTLFLAACGGDSADITAGNTSAAGPGVVNQTQSQAASAAQVAANSNVAGNSYSGFDMAGIYLGMSPEEVEAAIAEVAPDMQIKKDLIGFNYNAMGSRYETDSFVHYIGGNTYGGKLSLGIRLSYPPGPLKVVGLSRGDRHEDSPIPQAVYVESLIEKYGQPATDTGTTGTGPNVRRTLQWHFGDGTVQCFGEGREAATEPVLGRMQQDGSRYPDPTPEFAQQCISTLSYVLRGEPVVRANGSMLDVTASASAEFANQAWIQSLIDEKSQPGTDRPSL